MKAAGIIEQYNAERPNTVDDAVKLLWLRKCERMIANEIIMWHEHDKADEAELELRVEGSTLYIVPAGTIEDHINSFDMNSEMLVPEPYDDLYIYYIDQRIALNNNETRRYNAAVQSYNNALLTYQQHFNRLNAPVKAKKRFLRHENL